MKELKKTVTEYSKECLLCKKIFTGFNKKQLEYNFQIHFNSCKKRFKKEIEERK